MEETNKSIGSFLRNHYGQSTLSFHLPISQRRPQVLLCANTVKPLHEVVPRKILGQEWWNETRMAAYRASRFHCVACGIHKSRAIEHQWLEGHEIYSTNYQAGRMYYVECVALCHYCHSYIHDGRLRALAAKGEVSQEKLQAVLNHGNNVLKEAGLVKPPHYCGIMAQWSDWRLVLLGKEYPPIYQNYQQWLDHFNGSAGFDG